MTPNIFPLFKRLRVSQNAHGLFFSPLFPLGVLLLLLHKRLVIPLTFLLVEFLVLTTSLIKQELSTNTYMIVIEIVFGDFVLLLRVAVVVIAS